jgi:hypothetical protein
MYSFGFALHLDALGSQRLSLWGITLAIVMLVPSTSPAWRIAFDRFAETSIRIGVALILTVLWPDQEAATPSAMGKLSPQDSEGNQSGLTQITSHHFTEEKS